MKAIRDRRPARCATKPIAASASSRSEAPTATKNTTSTGGAPRCTATFSASPCAHREVLDHHARGHAPPAAARSCCVRADLAEQRAHAQQHQRDLAPDVAQVQREQRADQHAERHRAADLPREPGEHVRRLRRRRRRARPRANCIDTENSTSATRSASDHHRQHQCRSAGRARPVSPPPPPSSSARSDTTMTDSSATIDEPLRVPPASGAIGSHGQASHAIDGNADHRDGAASPASSARCRRAARPSRSTLSVRPAMKRDQRRRDPGDDLQLARHRLGDQVAEIRTDDDAEQQVAGQARQVEPAQRSPATDAPSSAKPSASARDRCRRHRGTSRTRGPRPSLRPPVPAPEAAS